MALSLEWDEAKSASNHRKHAVTFAEAQTAFLDERAIVIDDPEHSDAEDRFVLLGMSTLPRLLVCHCYREKRGSIRLIPARRANRYEQQQYTERWKR